MRRLTIMLGAMSIWLAWAATGHATECPRAPDHRPPVVTSRTAAPTPEYRYDLKRDAITKLFRSKKKGDVSLTQGHDVSVGLTIASFTVQIKASLKGYKAKNGMLCFWVQTAEAALSIPKTTVYVAANYPRGSCEFDAITAHEAQHVAINREIMLRFAPRMETALRQAVEDVNPIIVVAKEEANQTLNDIQNRMKPLLAQMERERDAANGVIDTPESYKRTRARCRNW